MAQWVVKVTITSKQNIRMQIQKNLSRSTVIPDISAGIYCLRALPLWRG